MEQEGVEEGEKELRREQLQTMQVPLQRPKNSLMLHPCHQEP